MTMTTFATIRGAEYLRGLVRWRVRPCLAFAACAAAAVASGAAVGGGLPALWCACLCVCAAFAAFAHFSSDYAAVGEDGTAPTHRYARWLREHRIRAHRSMRRRVDR
jgi:hypothetical protein